MNAIEYPTVRWASELPDHPALVVDQKTISYFELERRIKSAAHHLETCGVGRLDRVILCAANSVEWIITAHAIARVGAVLVPVSPKILAAEANGLLARYDPRLVLADSNSSSLWPISTAVSDIQESVSESRDSLSGREFDADAMHSIVATSGSEGTPKGVCLSFRNHLSNALGSALNLGVRPDDRWLLNLPLHHIGGMAIVFRAAIYGTTVVVHDRFDADSTWEVIESEGVTQLSLVATTLRRLLDAQPARRCPSQLRSVLVGGGPVPAELIDEARDQGFPILPTYGMTETASQIATLSPFAPEEKRHTAGHPIALAELKICDESGTAVPNGAEGRIYVRGPIVAVGYWTTDKSIDPLTRDDGWFPTSDVGSLDKDGYLLVHGRLDNVIISGGEKIHAEEIENAIAQCDGVSRVVVIGVSDEEWGQSPVAYIESAAGAQIDEAGILSFLRERLPRHKYPHRIEIVDEIPLLPSGKPDRQAMQARQRT